MPHFNKKNQISRKQAKALGIFSIFVIVALGAVFGYVFASPMTVIIYTSFSTISIFIVAVTSFSSTGAASAITSSIAIASASAGASAVSLRDITIYDAPFVTFAIIILLGIGASVMVFINHIDEEYDREAIERAKNKAEEENAKKGS